MTSKLQVTIPKRIAVLYGIRPGADVDWIAAGDSIRVIPGSRPDERPDSARWLELFDAATARVAARSSAGAPTGPDRGWTREELYVRGRAR